MRKNNEMLRRFQHDTSLCEPAKVVFSMNSAAKKRGSL